MRQLQIDRVTTPIGEALLVADGRRLCALEFEGSEERLARSLALRYGQVELAETSDPCGFGAAIRAYFAGELRAIDTIPVDAGGTPFQRQVWEALRSIPPGSTLSYGQLATRIGRPSAPRAVGAANGRNPVSLVVPCHRLLGADSSLVRYGGGLERKAWLLRHEGAWGKAEG